ncbi:MAG: DUF2470 domain-containing protein [Pseudomonadota bacterium]
MAEEPKGVLRTVDDAARRQAQTLLRCERLGSLATLEPGTGWPMVSRVSLATSMEGHPLFLASQLSPHFGAMAADGRVSLLLGTADKGDPLAHARMTVIGRAEILRDEARERNMRRFLARQPKAELYAFFGDFALWQLVVERVSLNGGFGKAYEMTAEDVILPPMPELAAMEAGAVEHMNDDHLDAIALYAEVFGGGEAGAWRLATLDPAGMDMVVGDAVARLWFDRPLKSAEDLRPMLVLLAKRARETGQQAQQQQ